MPDGFEPVTALEKIREFSSFRAACREDTEGMLQVLDYMIYDSDSDGIRLEALKLKLAYSYGKPAQQLAIRVDSTSNHTTNPVAIVLESNGREVDMNVDMNAKTIDGETGDTG